MTDRQKEYIEKWFDKAEHDLIAAKVLLEVNPIILDIACFHYQQSVEKFLKAFLVYKDVDFKKTPDVILLQKKCEELHPDFSKIDFKNLSSFAVEVRYPDNFLQPDFEEAKEYVAIAEQVKNLVLSKVQL